VTSVNSNIHSFQYAVLGKSQKSPSTRRVLFSAYKSTQQCRSLLLNNPLMTLPQGQDLRFACNRGSNVGLSCSLTFSALHVAMQKGFLSVVPGHSSKKGIQFEKYKKRSGTSQFSLYVDLTL